MRWPVITYDGAVGRSRRAWLVLAAAEALTLEYTDDQEPGRTTIDPATMRLDVPLGSSPRVARLDDGARVEFEAGADLGALEQRLGMSTNPWLVRLERSWPWVAGSVVLLVVLVFVGFRYVVPVAAADFAMRMNDDTRQAIGKQAMRGLDATWMDDTHLSARTRARIRDGFADHVGRLDPPAPAYRLQFRSSRIGPNAFALPGDIVVMTDELVELFGEDAPVHAVLLHELGHVEHRHALRAGLQRIALSLFATFILGDVIDVASVAGTLPALLIESGFSRSFEREADTFALDAATPSGLGLAALHTAFARLLEEFGSQDLGWLGTHPGLDERVDRVEARMAGAEIDTP